MIRAEMRPMLATAILDAGDAYLTHARSNPRRALLLAGAAFAHRVACELADMVESPYREEWARADELAPLGNMHPVVAEQKRPNCTQCGKPCAYTFVDPTHRHAHCSIECVQLTTRGPTALEGLLS
jgi:hypothetical protein